MFYRSETLEDAGVYIYIYYDSLPRLPLKKLYHVVKIFLSVIPKKVLGCHYLLYRR